MSAPKNTKPAAHCWEDGPPDTDGCSTTCMLRDGHAGAHVYTRDDEIRVAFSAATTPLKRGKR